MTIKELKNKLAEQMVPRVHKHIVFGLKREKETNDINMSNFKDVKKYSQWMSTNELTVIPSLEDSVDVMDAVSLELNGEGDFIVAIDKNLDIKIYRTAENEFSKMYIDALFHKYKWVRYTDFKKTIKNLDENLEIKFHKFIDGQFTIDVNDNIEAIEELKKSKSNEFQILLNTVAEEDLIILVQEGIKMLNENQLTIANDLLNDLLGNK